MKKTAIEKQYFTEVEAIKAIIEKLEDYWGYYSDLHHEVFNTDYYVVYDSEAIEALEKYGAFAALAKIQDYESFNFGKVITDLSEPCNVANMLWYIVGEEAICNAPSEFSEIIEENGDVASEETNEKLIEILEKLI